MGSFYPDDTRAICRLNHISMDTFKSTFMYKFFNPIEQFLGSVCKNRRQLKDSLDSPWFAGIFESILNFSPFLEETTQTVLSSPLALTFSDSLTFINNKKTSNKYFKVLFNMFAFWRNAVPAVQKRQQQLLAQMIAEGLSDESELFIRCEKYRRFSSTRLFVGAKLIHTLGGNVPFKTEVIRIWL
ncbi:hypothetical protein BLNAU_14614 [Blattamonas nauphoetae]|uniref:Uncharacterized protein n=1 Tax=Blattamonas nauphoetae TaxID=2049346 RepID=A0ABQ9XDC2_9EUKA|nr:hypothetical protein BLNAU_14614 [Blattamonas nauphoetae]